MINYLARVGWSYDDKTEIFSREELVRYFDLSGVNSSPARFSYERLEWMNGYYIRQLDPDSLAQQVVPFMAQSGFDVTAADMRPIVPLVQERLKTLSEIVERTDFFFQDQLEYDSALLVGKKMTAAESLAALQRSREALAALPDYEAEMMEAPMRDLVAELGLKAGQLFGIVRVAVTGKKVAPPLFDTMEVLGQSRCLERADRAIEKLASLAL